jgi:hypothetical protein
MDKAALLSTAASCGEVPDGFVPDASFGELVPDPQVIREFGITAMTLWRWDRDPLLRELGWSPPIYIRRRKFRPRRALEAFKAAMLRRAIEARNDRSAAPVAVEP